MFYVQFEDLLKFLLEILIRCTEVPSPNLYLKSYFTNLLQIVGRVLRKMPTQHGHGKIEDYPEHFLEALQEALALVGPVKCYSMPFVLPKQIISM